MLESGLIVMTAFISPINKDRGEARKLISNDDFIEIYCKASLETCETRDVKGLYKRARAGEIKNYTGIDSPYEVPENPELIIDTDNQSLDESVSSILSFLESNGIIN
jgi:adenylylsulfate kinase